MQPIVAVIAPGMMGSAVGARLVENGIEVRTSLTGRSDATVARAKAAGMVGASDEQIAASDIILSILPPGDALGLAERLAPALRAAAKQPIFVDCNALDPATVVRIARVVQETGASFVDGGIVGGPPKAGYNGPKIYLSGEAAPRVAELTQFGLVMPIQPGPIGAASAMKMSYEQDQRSRPLAVLLHIQIFSVHRCAGCNSNTISQPNSFHYTYPGADGSAGRNTCPYSNSNSDAVAYSAGFSWSSHSHSDGWNSWTDRLRDVASCVRRDQRRHAPGRGRSLDHG